MSVMCISGCNTGIESTKRITPNRADRRMLQPKAEEMLMDSAEAVPAAKWELGREILISDNRASLIYEMRDASGNRIHVDSLAGRIVNFTGISSTTSPGGDVMGMVTFRDPQNGNTLSYITNKKPEDLGTMTWNDLPLIVDKEQADTMARLLNNRRLWIRTPLWYDAKGNPVAGAKFVPVNILEVSPGIGAFPLHIKFTDGQTTAWLPMNMPDGKGNKGSRMFSSLFSLSDPKEDYPDIAPEIWDLICKGRVCEGMTKEECKLSLGNPKEVDRGHNWDQLLDVWTYSDGSYLFFINDRLSREKR